MRKLLLTLLIFSGLTNVILSQTIKTFKGTVDYKFYGSSTNSIKPEDKQSLEKEIDFYTKRMELLISYYDFLNIGNNKAAEKILSIDTTLSKEDPFTLALMFMLTRMKQLDILYKPCVQINDNSKENKLIVCTDEQQQEFIKHANSKEYKLKCKFIGNLVIEKMQVYQLINYE